MAFDYSFVLPPIGPADNAQVREMFEDVKAYVNTLISGGGTGAPNNATFITISNDSTLTNERALAAGTAISLTDNGAGSTIVVTNTGVTSVVAGSGISLSGGTGAVTITNTNPTVGATRALDNLLSVTINTSLLPGSTDTIDLGSASKTWRDIHIDRDIVLYEEGTANKILLKSPTSLAPYTLTFPDTAGTVDYVLRTDGSGTTSWVPQTSTGAFATKELDNLGVTAITAHLKPAAGSDNTYDLGAAAGKTWRNLYIGSSVYLEETGAGTDAIALTAPSSISSSYTFTFPDTGGTNGYVLKTNGSGTTSWVDPGTFPSGANTALSNLASVAINTTLVSDTDNTDDLGTSSIEWKTIYVVNAQIGKSGVAGGIQIYPTTASKGSLEIECANNTTDHILHITNEALNGASRTVTIPNLGANYSFVGTEGSQTINGSKTFGSQIVAGSSTNGTNTLGGGSTTTAVDVQYSSTTETKGLAVTNLTHGGYGSGLLLLSLRADGSFDTKIAAQIGTVGADSWNTDGSTTSYLTFQTIIANTLAERLRISSTGDIWTVDYTDYSSTSTVTGWSSFTSKLIYYKKIGKLVFVQFELVGTSNSTSSSFTLPFSMSNTVDLYTNGFSVDNGGTPKVLDLELTKNTSTVNLYPVYGTTNWTNTGTKVTRGQFFYQTT